MASVKVAKHFVLTAVSFTLYLYILLHHVYVLQKCYTKGWIKHFLISDFWFLMCSMWLFQLNCSFIPIPRRLNSFTCSISTSFISSLGLATSSWWVWKNIHLYLLSFRDILFRFNQLLLSYSELMVTIVVVVIAIYVKST